MKTKTSSAIWGLLLILSGAIVIGQQLNWFAGWDTRSQVVVLLVLAALAFVGYIASGWNSWVLLFPAAVLSSSALFFGMKTTDSPNEVAGGTQKIYLMPIVGHASKFAFGWAIGESANRYLALRSWKRAREMMYRFSIEPAGMVMHHDQDPVYTSYDWTGRLLL
jgi:hypothetical protein